ncbi:hypothetical protein B0T25DRAFT_156942 [Lasiosphaeria hispida]|uniref:Uncharacterized protein n=1 Tax=Lasiosphaeria hispida TaxID=260671 RepID=A0AAJ0HMC6_9PEZI|nr:hypothetical protein B0T25DRAFT_156942 [Lasiosphaeria hispida]
MNAHPQGPLATAAACHWHLGRTTLQILASFLLPLHPLAARAPWAQAREVIKPPRSARSPSASPPSCDLFSKTLLRPPSFSLSLLVPQEDSICLLSNLTTVRQALASTSRPSPHIDTRQDPGGNHHCTRHRSRRQRSHRTHQTSRVADSCPSLSFPVDQLAASV